MRPDLLEKMFSEHYNGAMLYALSLCRDRHLAEELVSIAFFKALQSADDSILSFRAWLFAVLRNEHLSHLRRRKKNVEIHENIENEDDRVLDKIIKDEEYRALYRALSLLPKLENEIITLFYFENLSIREISQIVEKSEGMVKTTLCRARIKLKEILEG